jgi:hypothetical protein
MQAVNGYTVSGHRRDFSTDVNVNYVDSPAHNPLQVRY